VGAQGLGRAAGSLPDRSYPSEGVGDTWIRVVPARRCRPPAPGRTP